MAGLQESSSEICLVTLLALACHSLLQELLRCFKVCAAFCHHAALQKGSCTVPECQCQAATHVPACSSCSRFRGPWQQRHYYMRQPDAACQSHLMSACVGLLISHCVAEMITKSYLPVSCMHCKGSIGQHPHAANMLKEGAAVAGTPAIGPRPPACHH